MIKGFQTVMQDTAAPATQTKAFHHLFPPVNTAWVHHTSLPFTVDIHAYTTSDLVSDCLGDFFSVFFFYFLGGILQCNTNMSVHWENCLLIIDECIVINHNS